MERKSAFEDGQRYVKSSYADHGLVITLTNNRYQQYAKSYNSRENNYYYKPDPIQNEGEQQLEETIASMQI